MPRKGRLLVPGAVHHVMARGIDGRNVFVDDTDRDMFLLLFDGLVRKVGFRCYAWALMPTHYHFLLRCNDRPLSSLMRPLNSRYARYYARKYNRRGYLFQDRFKSIATQDQNYVEELLRYVHLNPLRAGLCPGLAQLEQYPWCGHGSLLGKRPVRFLDAATVLKRFGANTTHARTRYRQWIADGVGVDKHDWIEKIRESNRDRQNVLDYGCWVLGDREFVLRALAADREKRARLARFCREGWDLERLAGYVAGKFGISPAEIRCRGHANARSRARKAFACLAQRRLDVPVKEIAAYLGISSPAVSWSLDEGGEIVAAEGLRVGD